jgi:hypothetical protein
MINKSVSPYLSFFFVLKCIALIFVSSNLYAATVDMTNSNQPLPYISFHPQLDKEKKNSYPVQNTSTDNNSSNSIVSGQNLAYITPTQDKPNTPSKNTPYGKITKSVKAFLDENADNTLLQGSLLTFGKAKKLFNETENKLNDLSHRMILGLDQYLQLELLLLQDNKAPRDFAYVNQQPKRPYLDAYKQNTIDEEIDISFLRKLLRISTLFYLIALIAVFVFFRWFLKFRLFGKYK